MDDIKFKTDNAILNLLLKQQEIEQVKREVGLVPNENGYETHAGKFFTTDDLITLRDKATVGLGSTKYTGIVAKKYDGFNDGQLVFDADGYARVGDVGSLQMIATREDSPLNNGIAFYEDVTRSFKTKDESTLSVAQAVNANKLGNVAASAYLRNNINNPKLSVSGGLTFTLEADSDNANESDNVALSLSQDGGNTTATLGLNNSNDLYLNHGSKQVFKYDEDEDDVIFNSTVQSSAKFNKHVIFSPDTTNDLLNLRRYGANHTLLNMMAPPQTSWGGAKECTLALVRGDSNEYYMDIYNMDYGSSDQGNHLDYGKPEMGIRLQKRGSGTYTPFYIEYGNGSEEFKAIEIHPNETDSSNHSSVTLNRLIANYDGTKKFETNATGTRTTGNSIVDGDTVINHGIIKSTGSNANYGERYGFQWARGKSGDAILWQTVKSGVLEFSSGSQFATDQNKIISMITGNYPAISIGRTKLETGNANSLRIRSLAGYVDVGSMNSEYCHFHTDRSQFYFNKNIRVDGELNIYGTATSLLKNSLQFSGTQQLEAVGTTGIKHTGDALFAGYAGSEAYVSGFSGSGWRIDQSGNGTLDSLTVRKNFNVYELNINKIRSGNGSYWFSDGTKVVSISENDSHPTLPPYYRLHVDTEFGMPFEAGDIIRCQVWTGKGIKYYAVKIFSTYQEDSSYDHVLILKSEFEGQSAPAIDDEIVRIGSASNANRQGAIYITSNDDNAPYIDVIDGVNSADLTGKTKARFGKLNGITSPEFGNLSGYGFWTQNGYLEGGINATTGKIANCTITTNSVSTSGWTLNSDGSGELATGNIKWNEYGNVTFASNVTLDWTQVSNTNSIASKSYAEEQARLARLEAEANAATDAQAKATDALNTAKLDATAKAEKAEADAIAAANAKAEAETVKAKAYADGIVTEAEQRAIDDATTKANNAEAAAIQSAKADATAKANAAKAAAIASAATDAATKAANAKNDAISAAAIDAKTKADKALADAKLHTGELIGSKLTKIGATGIYTGTLSADQILATGIKVGTGGIQLDASAVISWDKVTSKPSLETPAGAQAKADAALNAAKADTSSKIGNKLTKITSTGIYTGTLTADQIKATGIKVGTGGIQLDASAVISWDKVTSKPSLETPAGAQAKADAALNAAKADTSSKIGNKLTKITSTGIYTGTLTADQIKATGIKVGTGGIQLDASAVISWDKVTSKPSLETPAGAQAKADAALNAAKADTSSKIGNKLTKITSTGIYTGTLNASQINAGTISADRIDTGSITSLGNVIGGSFNLGNGTFQVDKYGKLTAKSGQIAGFNFNDTSLWNDENGSTLKIDAKTSRIEVRKGNSISYISDRGIFTNKAETDSLPASTGVNGASAAAILGFGNLSNNISHSNILTGIYCTALNRNSNPCPTYAIWAYGASKFSGGMFQRSKQISTYYDYSITKNDLEDANVFIFKNTSSSTRYINLPSLSQMLDWFGSIPFSFRLTIIVGLDSTSRIQPRRYYHWNGGYSSNGEKDFYRGDNIEFIFIMKNSYSGYWQYLNDRQ